MKNAKKLICLMISIFLLMPACDSEAFRSKPVQNSIRNPVNLYYISLDSLMPLDKGLNGDMKFISVDINSCKGLGEKDKKPLLTLFQKYKVKVLGYSLNALGEKGLFDKKNLLIKEGILLSVTEINVNSRSEIQLGVMKYRSGDGTIGNTYLMKYANGKWHIIKTISSFIS